MRPAYHSMAVGLVTGIYFFALLAVLARAWLAWRERSRPASAWATYADRAALTAAALAFTLTFAAVVTGFGLWPLEAVLNSPIIKNKLLTAALLLVFWGVFLGVRLVRGPGVWRSLPLTIYLVLVAGSGFVFGMITSSIGGDAAGNPSGFEQLPRLFGVETRFTFYLPTWLNLAIVGAGVLALLVAFLGPRQQREPAPPSTRDA